jgi:N-glycosylase/DNA lyase
MTRVVLFRRTQTPFFSKSSSSTALLLKKTTTNNKSSSQKRVSYCSSPARLTNGVVATAAAAAPKKAAAAASGGKMMMSSNAKWKSLNTTRDDLSLDRTLPTGQSFRWLKVNGGGDECAEEERKKCQYSTYVGVIGRRVVKIRERLDANLEAGKSSIEFCVLNTNANNGEEEEEEEEQITNDVRSYFNLDDPVPLKDLFEQFSKADPHRFGALSEYVRGARTLRQPPVECLISFVCSSNNNIARIKKMVESLCEKYGEQLVCDDDRSNSGGSNSSNNSNTSNGDENGAAEKEESKIYYAFPTVEQLAEKCDEQTLRDLGFGYRAKFIPAMAKELVKRGGESYLLKLRDAPQTEEEKDRTIAELTSLPGVGPKVAGCAALFSLDKKSVVPVDTHVWQLAREHFDPNGELASMETPASPPSKKMSSPTTPTKKQKDKPLSITPKMMKRCEQILVSIYGAYAGYAHTALFVAELPNVRESLPEHLRTPTKAERKQNMKENKKRRLATANDDDVE